MSDIPPYDHVCRAVGRLFLESQFELDRVARQAQELTQKLQAAETRAREAEAKVRDLESRWTTQSGNSP